MAVNVSLTKVTRAHLSRTELLDWINNLLKKRYTKIEEMCTGVAYCQVMHLLYPDSLQIKRVKCNANFEYEYLENFKLLKKAFDMMKVNRIVPFNDLVKGRFHDNLEFMQWFKKFYDANYNADDERDDSSTCRSYTIARSRSSAKKDDESIASNSTQPAASNTSIKNVLEEDTPPPVIGDSTAVDKPSEIEEEEEKIDEKPKLHAIQSIGLHTPRGTATVQKPRRESLVSRATKTIPRKDSQKQQLQRRIKELQQRVNVGRENIQYMEAVNRFYLEKIRNIMALCLANDEPDLQDYAKRVLYIISRKTSCISLEIEEDECEAGGELETAAN